MAKVPITWYRPIFPDNVNNLPIPDLIHRPWRSPFPLHELWHPFYRQKVTRPKHRLLRGVLEQAATAIHYGLSQYSGSVA